MRQKKIKFKKHLVVQKQEFYPKSIFLCQNKLI
jgi:hypothetical protein